eukprot:PhM_4_TR9504/c2_g1_i3/m.41883/K07359/CAMKK2; calcium/calmodulin-dependent protein kinase kinase 2
MGCCASNNTNITSSSVVSSPTASFRSKASQSLRSHSTNITEGDLNACGSIEEPHRACVLSPPTLGVAVIAQQLVRSRDGDDSFETASTDSVERTFFGLQGGGFRATTTNSINDHVQLFSEADSDDDTSSSNSNPIVPIHTLPPPHLDPLGPRSTSDLSEPNRSLNRLATLMQSQREEDVASPLLGNAGSWRAYSTTNPPQTNTTTTTTTTNTTVNPLFQANGILIRTRGGTHTVPSSLVNAWIAESQRTNDALWSSSLSTRQSIRSAMLNSTVTSDVSFVSGRLAQDNPTADESPTHGPSEPQHPLDASENLFHSNIASVMAGSLWAPQASMAASSATASTRSRYSELRSNGSRLAMGSPGNLSMTMSFARLPRSDSRATSTSSGPPVGRVSISPLVSSANQQRMHSTPSPLPAMMGDASVTSRSGDTYKRASLASSNVSSLQTSVTSLPPITLTSELIRVKGDDGVKLLNEYAILGDLGCGSYGKVKLALDTANDVLVAIKVLHRQRLRKMRVWDDVKNEITVMKELYHPNLVQLKGVIDDAEATKLYLILEYVSGGTAQRIVESHTHYVGSSQRSLVSSTSSNSTSRQGSNAPAFEAATLRKVFIDVLHGLQHLHERGIVHMDIKPENILLASDGSAKLADFGVSAAIQQAFEPDADVLGVEVLKGTPQFQPPEALLYDSFHGKPADVWALGVSLYMCAYGTSPFRSGAVFEMRESIMSDTIQYPSTTTSKVDVPDELIDVMRRCLCREPAMRITVRQLLGHPFFSPSKPSLEFSVRAWKEQKVIDSWLRDTTAVTTINATTEKENDENDGGVPQIATDVTTTDAVMNLSLLPPKINGFRNTSPSSSSSLLSCNRSYNRRISMDSASTERSSLLPTDQDVPGSPRALRDNTDCTGMREVPVMMIVSERL